MNRKNIFIGLGILTVVIAISALAFFNYLNQLMAFPSLEDRYTTVQSTMPDNPTCVGMSEEGPRIAKEIINLETDVIYIGGGTKPIPDDIWPAFSFRLPILKNSTRNLLFDESCFYRSPGVPADCEGIDECFIEEELVGYSWVRLTTLEGQTCLPDPSGCSGDVVKPGYVSISTIAKCQRIVFEGPIIYEMTDDKANKYVMHATGDGIPKTTEQTLPEGWSVVERTIDEPLVLLPFGGGDECYYNIVRDNLVQSYHQYVYTDLQYPPQGTAVP